MSEIKKNGFYPQNFDVEVVGIDLSVNMMTVAAHHLSERPHLQNKVSNCIFVHFFQIECSLSQTLYLKFLSTVGPMPFCFFLQIKYVLTNFLHFNRFRLFWLLKNRFYLYKKNREKLFLEIAEKNCQFYRGFFTV